MNTLHLSNAPSRDLVTAWRHRSLRPALQAQLTPSGIWSGAFTLERAALFAASSRPSPVSRRHGSGATRRQPTAGGPSPLHQLAHITLEPGQSNLLEVSVSCLACKRPRFAGLCCTSPAPCRLDTSDWRPLASKLCRRVRLPLRLRMHRDDQHLFQGRSPHEPRHGTSSMIAVGPTLSTLMWVQPGLAGGRTQ
jgi:hypothetical protein